TIDKNNDISDLKDIVWNKNKNTFSNIDANNLILWKVKIPISDKAKFKQLDFTESTIEGDLGGTKIDDASDEIKDVFGNSPVRKHIHIIIGQPTIVQPTTTTHALNQETQSLANEYNDRSLFSGNYLFALNRFKSLVNKKFSHASMTLSNLFISTSFFFSHQKTKYIDTDFNISSYS